MDTEKDKNAEFKRFQLLTKYIECQFDYSRWSSVITLLISITVAALIAVLGVIFVKEREWGADIKVSNNVDFDLNFDLGINDTFKLDSSAVPDMVVYEKNDSKLILKLDSTRKKIVKASVYFEKDLVKVKQKDSESNKKESLLRNWPLLTLLLCSVCLGLFFTFLFYLLRREAESEIDSTEKEIKQKELENIGLRMKLISEEINETNEEFEKNLKALLKPGKKEIESEMKAIKFDFKRGTNRLLRKQEDKRNDKEKKEFEDKIKKALENIKDLYESYQKQRLNENT